ncbi:MAG: site-specific integrase, partial [Methanospirillum sp.]|uniref:tyrosine-type recombinase/integrase n=1 Tax=Methanospirillum sp. TaxID=45200 RepID=UPI002374F50E
MPRAAGGHLDNKYKAQYNLFIYMNNPNDRFHRSESEYRAQCENTIKKHLELGTINVDDAHLIESWVSEVRATNGISNIRAAKLTSLITGARRWIDVPYDKMCTGDLFRAIDKINSELNLKQNTKADISRTLKRFVLWLIEGGYAASGLQIEKVRKVKPLTYQATKDESVLFTPTEIRAFIEGAKSPRDKAIIASCYEGGLRIGEIGNMRWKDLQMTDEWNISLKVNFKTGKSRHIPLVFAMPYLKEWMNQCQTWNQDDFVFTTRTGDPLQYGGVVKMMRRSLEEAGIKKHFTPHMLRHSRITHLIA